MKILIAPHNNPDLPASTRVLFIGDRFANEIGSNNGPIFQCAFYKLIDNPNISTGPTEPAKLEVMVLSGVQVQMTLAEWNAWPTDADDKVYVADFVLAKFGLTRADS